MITRRLLTEWLVLLLCLLAVGILAARAEFMRPIDSRLLDQAASLARAPASDDILIVAIDDASLAEIGPWPWPRSAHAELVDRLRAAGSGTVLYDVLFLEPTSDSEDAALGEAMAQHGAVIVPHTFATAMNTADGIVPVFTIEPIARGAAAQGHVAIEPDADGVLRRFDFGLEVDGQKYPHFVQQALALQYGELPDLPSEPLIAFHPLGSYTSVSAAEVLEGRLPSEFIRDRTILVGATAQGMGDRYSVGAREVDVMPGVETQANLLDAARTGGLAQALSNWWSAGLAWFALILQFLAFWRLSTRAGLIVSIVVALAVVAGAIILVPLTGYWIAPGAALMVTLLGYPFWSWRRLTSVSAYLEEEAAFLRPEGAKKAKVEGFDQIARQVSRMRRLVSNVSRSFQFMRKVIEAAPDAILVLDRDGRVAMVNRQAQQLFPHWQEEVLEPLESLFSGAGAVEVGEEDELHLPDGRAFLVARAYFEMEESAETGEIVALRDVSEIRRRAEQRREMLEFLSHDMRTPQVAIIGLSRRLQKGETLEEVGPRIRVQAERTLKLADDFVQLARLEEQELELEEADLVAVVEEACDRAYAIARAKQIRLDPQVPEEPLFARVDVSLIARMIDNLLGNAIKFAPEASRVEIRLEENEASRVSLIVADEGPGLPPERLENPFARFGAHESKAGPSVGLGLAFVKRVVDKHHGTISVRSERGKGARFEIGLVAIQP